MSSPPANTKKLDAMSRALGAAFLNHQVEMLEQTVSESRSIPISANSLKQSSPSSNGSRGAKDRVLHYSKPDPTSPSYLAKDAEVIITDTSVLIHSLPFVNSILHPSHPSDAKPVIVIPLEALNTLDLLKKGSTLSAKRAREASRLLEREVGENPNIRVQGEREYVGWDTIPFKVDQTIDGDDSSPEWIRRTVCCAAWEVKNAADSERPTKPRVAFAVTELTAVPVSGPVSTKNDYRAAGTTAAHWARKAGIHILDIPVVPAVVHDKKPAKLKSSPPRNNGQRNSSEVERPNRRPVRGVIPIEPTFKAIKTKPVGFDHRGSPHGKGVSRPNESKGLVEKGPAFGTGKVIRVLARGEKLDGLI